MKGCSDPLICKYKPTSPTSWICLVMLYLVKLGPSSRTLTTTQINIFLKLVGPTETYSINNIHWPIEKKDTNSFPVDRILSIKICQIKWKLKQNYRGLLQFKINDVPPPLSGKTVELLIYGNHRNNSGNARLSAESFLDRRYPLFYCFCRLEKDFRWWAIQNRKENFFVI